MRALLLAAAAAAAAAAAGAAAPPTLTPVFVAGKEGYSCFRIPALVVLGGSGGDELLAFAEGRKLSCADHGWNDLVSKRSLDGGATWGALHVVRSESAPGALVTVGNPAPIVLRAGGGASLLLPFCRNNLEVGVLRSDDRGHSWALTANVSLPPTTSWVATGPPGGLELQTGRLVSPMNYQDAAVKGVSSAFLSDDGGATWRMSKGSVALGNEDQVAELAWRSNASASVLHLSMRSTAGGSRLAAESEDGGETWSAPWPTIAEDECEGSVLALPRSRRLVMSSAFAAKRENMTLHASRDDGRSWKPVVQVFDRAAAYSSLVDLSPQGPGGGADAVGLLFEAGEASPYEQIAFTRFEVPA